MDMPPSVQAVREAGPELELPPRWVIAIIVFSCILLGGAVLLWLSTTHIFSILLNTVVLAVFAWAILKLGIATHATFKSILGHRLALVLALLVAIIVGFVLFAALDRMGHDIVHHYFDAESE
jgi:hypothetical protein